MISQDQANTFFRRGNDMGRGYAPEYGATVAAAVEGAAADGWEVVLSSRSTSDVTVLRNEDNELLAIGDVNGAWAVVLTDLLPTVEPVTVSGWYELVDGSIAKIVLEGGRQRTVRIARDWAGAR